MVDFTKPVTTESGCPVKIFTTEARGTTFPVIGEFYREDKWCQSVWTEDGQSVWTEDGLYYSSKSRHPLNLINPPEEIEGFFNMYEDSSDPTRFLAYRQSSMDEAIKNRGVKCIATIPIKFKKGEGL